MSIPILLSLGNIAGVANGMPANPFSQDILFTQGSVVVQNAQDGEIDAETNILPALYPLTIDAVTLADATDFAFINATVNGAPVAIPFVNVPPNTTVRFNFTRTTAGDPLRFFATVTLN